MSMNQTYSQREVKESSSSVKFSMRIQCLRAEMPHYGMHVTT